MGAELRGVFSLKMESLLVKYQIGFLRLRDMKVVCSNTTSMKIQLHAVLCTAKCVVPEEMPNHTLSRPAPVRFDC